MKINDPTGMGWEQCTFEGSEMAQLRAWSKLSVRQRLQALDQMNEVARHFLELRRKNGLPYIDRDSGEAIF